MRHRYLKSLGLLVPSLLALATPASAAPVQRVQFDLHGDFIVAGNTLGQDCATGIPAPLVGTVSNCGTLLGSADGGETDGGIDVLWRREPNGTFVANQTVLPSEARSRSFIDLTNRKVRYARLYWSGMAFEACGTASPTSCPQQVDATATLIGPDGISRSLTAGLGEQWSADGRYQASADVTSIVQAAGTGGYDVTGVDSFKPMNLKSGDVYAAWSMIIVYENAVESLRNVTIFDGFDEVKAGSNATGTIKGFQVPSGVGFDAKLGVVAWEGDGVSGVPKGDQLKFNDIGVNNLLNPSNDIFNGTRSNLGLALTTLGDRPQLTGAALSIGGADYDVFDIKPSLSAGATSAKFEALTTGDIYFLNAFVTSIATLAPDLEGVKTVKDVNGGTTLPGDVLEYKIVITNNGNDDAVKSVFRDDLPAGVTFVPGSLRLDAKALTDKSGDDQGELVSGAVVVRPFSGSSAGVIAQGQTTTVTFQVKVNSTFSGTLSNQAKVTAEGKNGDPSADYLTDGLQSEPGAQPTTIFVEVCDATNADACPGSKPFCDTSSSPNRCTECLSDTNCTSPNAPICDPTTKACVACSTDAGCAAKDPSTPACSTSGACVACTATNETACKGSTPACDPTTNTCVQCTESADCSSPTAVCDTSTKTCVQCLEAADCPSGGACNPTTHTCVACNSSADCASVTPICTNNTCGACTTDAACKAKDPAAPVCNTTSGECVACTPTNTSACPTDKPVCGPDNTCVACTKDDECTGGKVCDTTSNTCVGCVTSANCPGDKPICDPAAHTCGACSSDEQCATKDPANPVCLTNGTCGGCDAAHPDACKEPKPLCNTTTNTCVGCLTGADCTVSGAMVCDPKDFTCVECATSQDCSGGTPICDPDKRVCVACTSNEECADKGPDAPFCLESKGSCVACIPGVADACATGVCDPKTNTCVDCNEDKDCVDPAKPACNPGKKTCVECTETNDSACKGSKPTCDTGSNTCVGCTDDSECTGDKPVCDTDAHTCVGCSSDAQCAAKDPTTPVCSSEGTCVACSEDNTEACSGDTPVCDPATSQCVECVTNDDCPDPSSSTCEEGTCKSDGTSGVAGSSATGDIVLAGGACAVSFGTGNEGTGSLALVGAGLLALAIGRRRNKRQG